MIRRMLACRCVWMALALVVFGVLLGPAAETALAKKLIALKRFPFAIDPKTPFAELLPCAPDVAAPVPPWLVRDLGEVPEIEFAKPEPPVKRVEIPQSATGEEKRKLLEAHMDADDAAMKRTAHIIAKINHLNKGGRDRFVDLLREQRGDLDGLPFIMGDVCRQSKEEAQAFVVAVEMVHRARITQPLSAPPAAGTAEELARAKAKKFFAAFSGPRTDTKVLAAEAMTALNVAALMQMLALEDTPMRRGLVDYLAEIKDGDATRALARLAVYSCDAEVRKPALAALKARDRKQYTEFLLAALRYPWPTVIANAGDAVVQLDRKDMVPQLVALLDEPDPRAPVVTVSADKKTLVVREVVRLNHNRNCLLCHPPGNTPDVITDSGFPKSEVVTGSVPTPGIELPPPSRGYSFRSPDLLVRADTTYLRQDFSLLQPVKDAAPWPEQQRFDFLVRTRVVTKKDAAAYQAWLKQQGANYLAPHRQAALTALRALTRRDAGPTAQAWRRVLAE